MSAQQKCPRSATTSAGISGAKSCNSRNERPFNRKERPSTRQECPFTGIERPFTIKERLFRRKERSLTRTERPFTIKSARLREKSVCLREKSVRSLNPRKERPFTYDDGFGLRVKVLGIGVWRDVDRRVSCNLACCGCREQGSLAHKKQPPPRTTIRP